MLIINGDTIMSINCRKILEIENNISIVSD
jgi:hypothetical protein